MKLTLTAVALAATLLASQAHASQDAPTAHEQKALEIYRTAISMRTAEGFGNVPKLANYLAAEFKAAGFDEADIHIKDMGETAALIVRYRGDGSSGKKPILLSAHMDVVDAHPEDWERDPFTLIEEDGYFFGRGTADNKMGITSLTSTFLRLKAEGFVPTRDLIIAFSGDEESGMVTTKALANDFRDLTDAEFVLIADAGGGALAEDGSVLSYNMQAAEKTYVTFEMTVTNPGGHSSRPRSDNAIYDLADALKKIQAYQFPVSSSELTRTFFRKSADQAEGDLGKAMAKFAKNPNDAWAVKTLRSYPEYVGTTGTTCVATMLKAGHAENALPQTATATVNCRIFPGAGVDNTLNTLKEVVGNPAINWTVIYEPTESPASQLRDDVIGPLTKAVHALHPGVEIVPYMESGGTDGMHFRAAGMDSYGVSGIFMKGSDVYAHGLNERLPVKAFYDALEHWHILLTEIAG
ncbi:MULTISPECIES: M20/M25/M40 family metallo-hydrolase [Kordiimonas]|jgi:acetylornithine deacetylase/succinyl-diaminopimelate desuccinylase-like protein|uniref:M20/M25/M40 family metallo-hydrolase n=1 Tax=Kordiimonas TaxID=288021 RepID=UPI00257F0EBE|nr:M20/M25/M40 family metallo-hydrolase [Kordiimonas sp. UBA4487]